MAKRPNQIITVLLTVIIFLELCFPRVLGTLDDDIKGDLGIADKINVNNNYTKNIKAIYSKLFYR